MPVVWVAVSFLFALLFIGCDVDFPGLLQASSDLDERLRERDNLTFVDAYGSRSPVLGDSYSFMVVTDVHINNGKTWGLSKLLDVITPDIRFVVFLGDITQTGAREDIEAFIDFAGQLREKGVYVYASIGNHDIYFGNWPNWKELIGSTSYRIDGDVITFFIMDSANSFFGDKQLNWLERELEDTNRDVFVFTHVNLFAENVADTRQMTDLRERARIVHALRGKCDIMFMGHLHKTLTHEAGGVKYIGIDEFKDWKTYCVVTVTGAGETKKISYVVRELY